MPDVLGTALPFRVGTYGTLHTQSADSACLLPSPCLEHEGDVYRDPKPKVTSTRILYFGHDCCCYCCTSSIVAIKVQQLLLEGAWSDKVLALPGCGPALSSSMEVVWVGPRARMGISEAIPSRVVPHTTSGRADYFGPLVNRYVIRLLVKRYVLWPLVSGYVKWALSPTGILMCL